MKIGIVSDSHGDTRAIDTMLAHPAAQGVERWFFAGDILPDAEYLAITTGLPVEKVAGNNDWPDVTVPDTRVTEAAGHRILLTHGHRLAFSTRRIFSSRLQARSRRILSFMVILIWRSW